MKQSSQKAFKIAACEGTVREALDGQQYSLAARTLRNMVRANGVTPDTAPVLLNGLRVLLSQTPIEGLDLADTMAVRMRRSGGSSVEQKREMVATLQDFAAQRVRSGNAEGVSRSLEAANIVLKLCKNDPDLFAGEIAQAQDVADQFGARMKEIADAQHMAYYSANPRRFPGWS